MKNILIVVLFGTVLISSYKKDEETGVCTGADDSFGFPVTYCKDGWTRADCNYNNEQRANGVEWFWFEGQTCAGRGTPATL